LKLILGFEGCESLFEVCGDKFGNISWFHVWNGSDGEFSDYAAGITVLAPGAEKAPSIPCNEREGYRHLC
jgi:hypothetical protein